MGKSWDFLKVRLKITLKNKMQITKLKIYKLGKVLYRNNSSVDTQKKIMKWNVC